ncbi:MAG: metal-dependent hydrolase [Candidatus Micrarchaeota archaeon]|nr:metal-dependent hydrolase [Candidatus Micrarchaeota archaeon]
MPNALAHVVGGAVVGILLAAMLPASVQEKVICGIIAIGGSLVPDIDHPQGTARKVYRKVGICAGAILIFIIMLWLGVGLAVAILCGVFGGIGLVALSEFFIPKHRGIIHSWGIAVLSSLLAYALLTLVNVHNAVFAAFSFFAGYASHLILDSLL